MNTPKVPSRDEVEQMAAFHEKRGDYHTGNRFRTLYAEVERLTGHVSELEQEALASDDIWARKLVAVEATLTAREAELARFRSFAREDKP